MEKKSGAGAAKNLAGSCEKIKSIRKLYFSYSFLSKILSFMVKKDNYFTCYIFFCSFALLVCGEKTILPRSQSRSRVFLAPWSRSRSKKIPGAGATWEKIRSRSRLKKRQEPEPLKNLPAPQPWNKVMVNKR